MGTMAMWNWNRPQFLCFSTIALSRYHASSVSAHWVRSSAGPEIRTVMFCRWDWFTMPCREHSDPKSARPPYPPKGKIQKLHGKPSKKRNPSIISHFRYQHGVFLFLSISISVDNSLSRFSLWTPWTWTPCSQGSQELSGWMPATSQQRQRQRPTRAPAKPCRGYGRHRASLGTESCHGNLQKYNMYVM